MSDWYFHEALKKVEKARRMKGASRRKNVLAAIRNLIAFVVGKKCPINPPIASTDEARCDRCFAKLLNTDKVELCSRCEHGVTPSGRASRAGINGMRINGVASSALPDHEERIEEHTRRVQKHMRKLPHKNGELS